MKLINGNARLGFFPKHFGPLGFMALEAMLYRYAGKALTDPRTGAPVYTGGLWEFVEADNGAGFCLPPITGPVDLNPINDMCCPVRGLSREAAGMALTVMATNHALWLLFERLGECPTTERLNDEYFLQMDACRDHTEAAALLTWLD